MTVGRREIRQEADANRSDPIRQVDRFLETEIEARALALAFSRGLIDRLAGRQSVDRSELAGLAGMPENAFGFFLQLLAGNGVIRGGDKLGRPATKEDLPLNSSSNDFYDRSRRTDYRSQPVY